jgi:hypothetical protein
METVRRRLTRLLWAGPLTVAASVAAVAIVQRLALALLTPPSAFALAGQDLIQIRAVGRSPEPLIFTALLVSCALLVFVIVCREAINPIQTYRRIAFVVLLVSFVPDVVAAMAAGFGWPLAMLFMVMHVAAYAPCVTILTGLPARSRHPT